MKRTIIYGVFLFSLSLTAQQHKICGFDQTIEEQDRQNPGMREAFEKIVKNIKEEKAGNPSAASAKLVNGVYEIPVVVHVVYPNGAAIGSTYNKSDAQIQAWLDRANQMYAGTYAWPANGVPADFGTSAVFPIKLVLAKRDPNCNATTGIVRYNGNSLSGYNTYGMAYQTNNGASRAAIKGLAPHWPEASYFNIYVISTFDGSPSPNSGLMGFAAFPNNLDANYESFMKSGVVTNAHDTTFAHEFGHAMGLYHTFDGGNYAAVPGDLDYCPPTTGVCEDDDDGICDTEYAGSGYALWPVPTNSEINPCTGLNYQGVQYNMMNYSNSVAQKFTVGQGESIDNYFMIFRGSLTTSKGATALPSTTAPSILPVASTCNPTGMSAAGNFLAGPTLVKLGQINNESQGYSQIHPKYYVDYTLNGCLANAHTSLTVNQQQTVTVEFLKATSANQSIRVWIDYNNNGTFETSELVASGNNVAAGAGGFGTFTASFTPPSTAVMNTPLRMRVLADMNNPSSYSPCGQLGSGQIEDYSVTLVSNLATNDVKADADNWVIYPNPSSAGEKLYIKTKNSRNLTVTVSDMSGRVIEKPSLSEEGNGTLRINHHLEKGVYMLQVSDGKESKSSKLIIK
ncbi:GEVED domain-containing protein [uncultured Chryseobacterium sp.]|uniref:zinc-dependent metalloprotease n=1 Tax=uncultured Chryseobacterium sp. TaxID=259322 RepID=UPI002600D63B|nr:GEVED domain-containing protein [uncultured Chryseobacterium sp.]